MLLLRLFICLFKCRISSVWAKVATFRIRSRASLRRWVDDLSPVRLRAQCTYTCWKCAGRMLCLLDLCPSRSSLLDSNLWWGFLCGHSAGPTAAEISWRWGRAAFFRFCWWRPDVVRHSTRSCSSHDCRRNNWAAWCAACSTVWETCHLSLWTSRWTRFARSRIRLSRKLLLFFFFNLIVNLNKLFYCIKFLF